MVHRNWSGILRLRNTIGCGTVLRLCIHYTLHWTRIGGTGSLLWPSLGAVRPIIDDATCRARGFEEHKKPGRKGLRKAQTLEPVLQGLTKIRVVCHFETVLGTTLHFHVLSLGAISAPIAPQVLTFLARFLET